MISKNKIRRGYSVGASQTEQARRQKVTRRSVSPKEVRGQLAPQYPPKKV